MAELAVNQEQLQMRLMELTPTVSPQLREMWEAAASRALNSLPGPTGKDRGSFFAHELYVLISCRDEQHQIELLHRFQAEGLECPAKLC
jgi:hypothetical protein